MNSICKWAHRLNQLEPTTNAIYPIKVNRQSTWCNQPARTKKNKFRSKRQEKNPKNESWTFPPQKRKKKQTHRVVWREGGREGGRGGVGWVVRRKCAKATLRTTTPVDAGAAGADPPRKAPPPSKKGGNWRMEKKLETKRKNWWHNNQNKKKKKRERKEKEKENGCKENDGERQCLPLVSVPRYRKCLFIWAYWYGVSNQLSLADLRCWFDSTCRL